MIGKRVLYSQTLEWLNVVRKTYTHPAYRLFAQKGEKKTTLNLVYMRHWLFGKSVVAMPFSDVGGIIVEDDDLEKELFAMSMSVTEKLNAETFELRMDRALTWLDQDYINTAGYKKMGNNTPAELIVQTHKVRMVLDLPDSSETLMSGFKSKLRSQIKRPIKDGMWSKVGRNELLDDFYNVFCVNMRDLGSPVHSKDLFDHLLKEFSNRSHVIMVYSKKNEPVAGAIVVGEGRCLSNPWASSLMEFRSSSPNMLLYWTMFEHAISKGYKQFDFGRSSVGEGTHTFKKQWGTVEKPLFWYTVSRKGTGESEEANDQDNKFDLMINIWKRLPVSLTRIIGPPIRKYISL